MAKWDEKSWQKDFLNMKSHSFYTVSSLEEFAKMLDTEWAREWDKANNCKDIVYKLEIVE